MKPLLTRAGLLALLVVPFAFLLPSVAPHVTAGDAAELALAGSTLGIAHPPGYPAFALIQHAAASLLPFGNAAYQQNVVSALCLSAALVLLGALIVRLTGQRWTLALPALLMAAPLFRRAGETTEVFPLTFLWACGLLLAAFRVSKRPTGGVFLAFLLGLAAAVHQTLLLMTPAVAFLFLRQQERPMAAARRHLWPCLAAFAGGLSIHLYLPIRSSAAPVLDWEDPQTLRRFWDVVTRARYGFFHLAQGGGGPGLSFGALIDALSHARRFHIENLGWSGAALLVFGSLHSLARRYHRRTMIACWLHILFTGPVFFWLAAVPFGRDPGVLQRFGLLPMAGIAVLMAIGVAPLWSSGIRLYRGFMIALLAVFAIEAGVRTERLPGLREDASLREAALNALAIVPAGATLFADRADEMEFALAFALGGEGRRKDVRFVDCNGGVTPSIYGDDYHRIWGEPRLRLRERVETAIVSAAKVPVIYATVDPAMIDVYRTPRGFLYRAWPLDVPPTPTAIPWHLLLSWRTVPIERRGRAVFQSNLDLLGRALFETGHRDAALNAFGLAQRAGGPSRWEQLGYWLYVRGDLAGARDAYERADAAGVESEAFFVNFGAFLNESGKVVPAIETYERGLVLFPTSTRLLYNLAVARWETGSTDEARVLLKRVLALDPFHVDAQRLMTQPSHGKRI